MTKIECVANLNKIADEANSHKNGYKYKISIKDWNAGDKSRTYFSIFETRENSKKFAKKDYGYFDNVKNEYVATKYAHLDGTLFTFSGAKLD